MDMIFDPAKHHGNQAIRFEDGTEICVKFGTKLLGQPGVSALGTKYGMQIDLSKGLRHDDILE